MRLVRKSCRLDSAVFPLCTRALPHIGEWSDDLDEGKKNARRQTNL